MTAIMLSKEVNYYVMPIMEMILSEKNLNQEKKDNFSFLPSLIKYISFH